jgi:hypothetical protein
MKRILFLMLAIVLLALCHIQFNLLAQNVDSLIDIKGCYVTVFSKQEIVFSYEQRIIEERELSYSIPIDYSNFSFFVPVQVGNKLVCEKDMISEKILNYVQNDSVYVIVNGHNKNVLQSINIVTVDISKETCILSNAMRFSPYYEISGDSSSLYKCTYIEGCAQYKHIQEVEKKWENYLLNICFIDKKMENAKFFFIEKINTYTPYIEIPKLKKWLPYLD